MAIVQDVYSQPNAPDPVLDDETVLRIARRHLPGARTVTGVDESGGEARTYAVDGDVIVKTQRPHRLRPRTSLKREALFLRHLAAAYSGDPLPVPRVFGHGREDVAGIDGGLEYICMSRVPGVAVARTPLHGPARTAALRALGAVLARVHRAPQSSLVESRLFPGDRSATDVAARAQASLNASVRALHEAGIAWPDDVALEAVVAAPRRNLPDAGRVPLVALHSNPGPTHTFVDSGTGALTGLIDFGDAYVGHPAHDLVRWPDAGDRDALLQGYAAAGSGWVDETFLVVWRVLSIAADLQAAARQKALTPAIVEQVRRALARF